jgi:hypothetical protein
MRKFILFSCSMILALAGCGGGVTLISDTISPSATQTLDVGQSVTFTATVVNDPSNSGVTWSVINGANTLSSITSTSVVYTAPATAAGTTVAVEAVPVKNTLFAAATQIVIAPALAISTNSLPAGTIGTTYSAQLQSTGVTGALTYALASGTLPAGLSLSAGGVISGTPSALANSTFTVSVTDSASTPVTATKILTLVVTAPTLSITTASLPNGVSGKAYSVQLAATGGVTPYAWTLSGGALPVGLSLSASGLISGTPSSTGSFSVTPKVTDNEPTPQTASKTLVFTVYPQLVITTTTLPTGSVNNSYSVTLAATGGTNPLVWSLAAGSTLPVGLTLSSAGVISGAPKTAGSTTFTVQVADSSSPQQVTTMVYTINVVLSTLAITTTTLPQGTIGVTYTSTALTYSGGNPPVTWSLATGSSLPAGLTLSSAGVISGKPTGPAGTATFTVQATDSTPATVTQQLSITVVALAALSVSTTTIPGANIGSAYSTTLAATGGATPYTWSITSGALPAGLSLSSGGVISGTPLAAGSFTFTAQVADSQSTPATASRSFTLTVGTTLSAGAGNAMLNGSYAFLLQGYKNGAATGTVSGTAAIGSLTANGSGVITGIQDINSPTGVTSSVAVSGTYSVGTDGRGLMVLTAGATTSVYALAASNLSGAIAQSIAITEFDNSTGAAATTNAAGFAKLQTATAFNAASVKGAYAFGLSGESPCASCATGVKLGPLAAVGVFTADGISAVSAGSEDAGAYATNYTGVTFTGSYTAPSTTTGRGTLTVINTGTLFPAAPVSYTYVVVNAGELLLMSNASHATTSLLAGDARLQTTTGYTAASLTGAVVGYESQGSGGDGATIAPSALNATLSRLAFTGSGTATLAQDSNRAGTFSTTAATAVTYTTATTGRSLITTGGASNQVLYSYAGAAGFALDQAATGTYPALITYESQVAVAPYPPLLSNAYAASTLATAAPATDVSGSYVFLLSSGGVNSTLNGTLATTLDSSSPAGTLALGTTSSLLFLEDTTGRLTTNANGSSAVQGVVYGISSTRAVAISTGASSTPIVTVLQR